MPWPLVSRSPHGVQCGSTLLSQLLALPSTVKDKLSIKLATRESQEVLIRSQVIDEFEGRLVESESLISRLEDRLARRNRQISKLQDSLAESEMRISELEVELKDRLAKRERQISRLQDSLAVSEKRISELEEQVGSLGAQLSIAGMKWRQFQSAFGDGIHKINELERALARSDSDRVELIVRLSGNIMASTDLESRFDESIRARKELEDRLRRAEHDAQHREVVEGERETKRRRCEESSEIPLNSVLKGAGELANFVAGLAHAKCCDEPVQVPVLALRFTHRTINADFAFGEDHDNRQESIMKLFFNLFGGRTCPDQLPEPLHVFKHRGPDGHVGLYSRNNRRLLALLMYQAVRRDELIKVPCLVWSPDDQRPAPFGDGRKTRAQWFKEGYDLPSRWYNGLGLSIWPRRCYKNPKHRGYPFLDPAGTTLMGLQRVAQRMRDGDTGRSMLDWVLTHVRKKRIGPDEETLTCFSDPGEHRPALQ